MLSEIVFIKGQIELYGMLGDVTWRAIVFRNRNRRQKDNFSTRQCSYYWTAVVTEKWFQNFAIELLQWRALSSDLNTVENLRGIPAGKLYDREKPPLENIVEHKKRIKFA